MTSAPRLFLIDGSALAYRSHFAFASAPLSNRRGMQTGAVFGFTTSLLRLIEKEKPDYLVVVFDAPEKTFRHEEYPEYKATREKMPDEMADQLPYIRKVVEAMRIPFITMPGFEADDVIGTLTKKAERNKIDAFVVSGDKDFLQLLGPRVRMYNLKKKGEVEILGEDAPKKRWGIPVARVTDLLALMGDSSDNVPGVPGVGEKTATRLVQEHGSLEEIYARIDKITPPKLREKLTANKEQAELSKHLVTIRIDVPLSIDVHDLKSAPPDTKTLRTLYEELNFNSLLNSLTERGVRTTGSKAEKYNFVDTEALLAQLVDQLLSADEFAFDTETTGLGIGENLPIGISFSVAEGEAYYVPLDHTPLPRKKIVDLLKPILESSERPKGGQNVKFDRAALLNLGIQVSGISFDTMIESYLLDPESRQHNLDLLARRYLNIEKIPTSDLIGKGKHQISMFDVDPRKVSYYACEDADLTFRLHKLFLPQLEQKKLTPLYRDVEIPLIEVLGDMEQEGIAVQADRLRDLSSQVMERLKELTGLIHAKAGTEFNINSPAQLGPIFFEKLRIQDDAGVKRVKKTKTGYATDQGTLEQYPDVKIVSLLLEYRNLSKLHSTYMETLPKLVNSKTKRIHTSFNQTVTATGRLSSSDPNLQNIPIRTELGREIRKAFISGEPGWKIVSADYSQIELRLLAHLAQDKVLTETFSRDEDVHRRTAALIFNVDHEQVTPDLRNRAKAINFGVIYGMGSQRLARETGISLQEAKDFIESYFEKLGGVKEYLESQVENAREKEYVTTLLGRRRLLPDITSNNPRISTNAERIAVNTPIQGSAADLIKVAMIRIHRGLEEGKFKARMLLQVHDELVFEAPPDEIAKLSNFVKREMENAIELSVPIVVHVGVGDNWADAH